MFFQATFQKILVNIRDEFYNGIVNILMLLAKILKFAHF